MGSKNSVTVKTEHGPVKGVQSTSAFGRKWFRFQTIPYMKAPIGNLRFRDPREPDDWVKPFDATVKRPSYLSLNLITNFVEGSEDAGVLSITTPYLDGKLPVAVCKLS